MARGDECKTASKANYACKNLDVTAPMKKSLATQTSFQQVKKPEQKQPEQKKDYGAWGPVFKGKNNFTDMHFC